MNAVPLTLRSINVTPVVVPMRRPLWTSVQALRVARFPTVAALVVRQ